MNKNIIMYLILGALIVSLLILTLFPGITQTITDSRATEGKDKCSPSSGYTEESWREHMSHHPSMYKECLE